MGNSMYKFCKRISHHLRACERRKTMKIYKEVVLQSDPEEGARFIPDTIELIWKKTLKEALKNKHHIENWFKYILY